MTTHIATQILLTLFITGVCTLGAVNFVTVAKDAVNLQKWFTWTARIMFMFHVIAFPAAIINLIWSF